MSLYGKKDQYSDAPKFVVNAATGEKGQEQFGNTVFGVDTDEAAATDGVTHSGWVRRTVGTGGRSGRVQIETLVAQGSIEGDASDFANTDAIATANGAADDSIFPDS